MSSSINIFAPKNTLSLRNLGENNMERFQTDISLNGKTKYQDKDNLIHSLQEELSTMKYKMSFYFEKEKEIQDLQQKIKSLEGEIKNVNKYKLLILKLKKTNDNISEHYKKLLLELHEYDNMKKENILLKDKIKELTVINKKPKNELDIIIEELSNNISNDKNTDDEDNINDINEIIEDIGNTDDLLNSEDKD
tara:strand:- start:155 stop:733 length:579 start_codon:yes stop_codon:yes gene_type:complete